MCNSVEMYLPALTRRAAEHRIGEVDLAPAGDTRAAGALLARLLRALARAFRRQPVLAWRRG